MDSVLVAQLSQYDPHKVVRVVDGGASVGCFVQCARDCPPGTTIFSVPWVDVLDREKALLMLALCCSHTSPSEAPTLALANGIARMETNEDGDTPLLEVQERHAAIVYWQRIAMVVEQLSSFCTTQRILDETLYAAALLALFARCPERSPNSFLYRLWFPFRWVEAVVSSCGDMSLPLLLLPASSLTRLPSCDSGVFVVDREAEHAFLTEFLCDAEMVEEVLKDRAQLWAQTCALRQYLVESLGLRVPLTEEENVECWSRVSMLRYAGWIRSRWICCDKRLQQQHDNADEEKGDAATPANTSQLLWQTIQCFHRVRDDARQKTQSTTSPAAGGKHGAGANKKGKNKKNEPQQKVPSSSSTSFLEYYVVPVVEKLNHSPHSTLCPTVDWGSHVTLRYDGATSSSAETESRQQCSSSNASSSSTAPLLREGSEIAIYYGCHSNRYLFTRYGFLEDPCIPSLGYNSADLWKLTLQHCILGSGNRDVIFAAVGVKPALWMPAAERDAILDDWQIDPSSLWAEFPVSTISWLQKPTVSTASGGSISDSASRKQRQIPVEVLFSAAMWAGSPLLCVERQTAGRLGKPPRPAKSSSVGASNAMMNQKSCSTTGTFFDADPDVDEQDGMWQFDRQRMLNAFLAECPSCSSSNDGGPCDAPSRSAFWRSSVDVLEGLVTVAHLQTKQCLERAEAADGSSLVRNQGALFWAQRFASQRLTVLEGLMGEVRRLREAGPTALC